MIGQLHSVVIDAPDAHALATFYAGVLGMEVKGEPGDDWVVITGAGYRIAEQVRVQVGRKPGQRAELWSGHASILRQAGAGPLPGVARPLRFPAGTSLVGPPTARRGWRP